jgi:hypothetical protein
MNRILFKFKFSIIFVIILLVVSIFAFTTSIQASRFPSTGGDGGDGDGGSNYMPDYARDISVEEHYIIIQQDSEFGFTVEEWLWFNNTGSSDFTGKLYTWASPGGGSNFDGIARFDAVINDTNIQIMPEPSGNFLVANLSKYAVSIETDEDLQIVYVYHLTYPDIDEYSFTKLFLYNNSNVIIMIKPFEDLKVEGKDFDLIFDETSNTYANEHYKTLDRSFSENITFIFSKKSNTGNGDPNSKNDSSSLSTETLQIIFVAVILIVCIIVTVLIKFSGGNKKQSSTNKSKAYDQDRKPSQRRSSSSHNRPSKRSSAMGTGSKDTRSVKTKPNKSKKSRSDLVAEKKMVLKATKRLKLDYKDDIITKETHDKLREDYKQKLNKINKKIARYDKNHGDSETDEDEIEEISPELEKLYNKKEKILKAIKKLEEDKKAGNIDEELYEEMIPVYKKQAIDILKKIDNQKGK